MERKEVLIWGVCVRISLFILQIIFNNICPHWVDAENFNPPIRSENRSGDHLLTVLFDGYYQWDAKHMLTISQYGYICEKSLAFYPLYPLTIAVTADLLPLFGQFSCHYMHLFSGILINFVLFLFSLDRLYMLTQQLINQRTALITSALFCINPATIFMTAPYTEILFFSLTLHGLYLLEIHRQTTTSALIFGLSYVTRSNGVVNFGFILYHLLWPEIGKFARNRRPVPLVKAGVKVTWNLLIFLTPYLIHVSYAYKRFCHDQWTPFDFPEHLVRYSRSLARGECRLPSDGRPPWCTFEIPLFYSYVQSHYWDVGFLRYFVLSKIVNFVLAGPVIALTVSAVSDFYVQNRSYCRTLGFGKCRNLETTRLFMYAAHAAGLLAITVPFIHIEVLTRLMFSSSPFLYWYSARLVLHAGRTSSDTDMTSPDQRFLIRLLAVQRMIVRSGTAVTWYFVGYALVGTAAFVNGLPWT